MIKPFLALVLGQKIIWFSFAFKVSLVFYTCCAIALCVLRILQVGNKTAEHCTDG